MKVFGFSETRSGFSFYSDMTSEQNRQWWMSYIEDGGGQLMRRPSIASKWIPFEGGLTAPEGERATDERPDLLHFFPSPALFAMDDAALARTDNLWGLVEVLPLRCRDADVSAIHIPTQYDIVTEGSSFISPRNMSGMDRFIVLDLDTSNIRPLDLFRIPETPTVWCTEEFLVQLEAANVTGWRASQKCPPPAEHLQIEQDLIKKVEDGTADTELNTVTIGDLSLRATATD